MSSPPLRHFVEQLFSTFVSTAQGSRAATTTTCSNTDTGYLMLHLAVGEGVTEEHDGLVAVAEDVEEAPSAEDAEENEEGEEVRQKQGREGEGDDGGIVDAEVAEVAAQP